MSHERADVHQALQPGTGPYPAEWCAAARLRHARHLLESTELPVDDIAARSGMGSGTDLRQHMRAALTTTPSAYRRASRSAGNTRAGAAGGPRHRYC
ncbi:helix-turn-helix domain-containing protein [Streptomyces albofaciens]|uniref:helix-turn-helix domain-containing protein n=1 Tax=Streptomyces albofaciens TaxID=66866 RepID=UPI001FCABC84|nr:helix-turn-helix domain-containing protein [Streptomyces albofaciens]